MKKTLSILIIATIGLLSVNVSNAQCTPGDSISCPDIENNGELCPDTLPGAIAGQLYHQDFTILAPPEYTADSIIFIPLHHIKLMDIENLPAGISWVSNAEDSIFMVGTYYCVLMEGTPTLAGHYPLKIKVGVYINVGEIPVYAGEVTDSTSLFIDVIWDPDGISNPETGNFRLINSGPNPFYATTQIGLYVIHPEKIYLDIYNLLGIRLYHEEAFLDSGENFFRFNGASLSEGMYFYTVYNTRKKITQTLIKTR